MYVKPQLQRFGSVRELTKIGIVIDCDGGIGGPIGCDFGGGQHDGDRS